MKIIAHRGLWTEAREQNGFHAFEQSLRRGFGVETDIRELGGELVISHDPPVYKTMSVDRFFKLYTNYISRPTLALNIKAGGLQAALKSMLDMYQITNYFVFDMAVPDGLTCLKYGMNTYTRHSEYEPVPPYYEKACGVWLDEFDGHWLTDDIIERHLSSVKEVCIVSPELHGRSYENEWQHYCDLEKKIGKDRLMLCTDLPELANEFFNV